MITPSLEAALNSAFDEANKRKHEYVTLEHLLYALFKDPDALLAMRASGIELELLEEELERFFDEQLPKRKTETPAEPTLGLNRTVQRAVIHAQGSSRQEVTGADILIHLFAEKESYALYLLESQGATRLDFLNYVSHGITKEGDGYLDGEFDEEFEEEANEISQPSDQPNDPLEQFTMHLNQRAQENKIDPLVGRENEVERVMQVLCRRKKNNPVIVGEAGVGKTAIVEGLASRIESSDIPELLQNTQIYALDLGALLAGTKFRGDFEARLKDVLKSLQKIENSILFIDEIHTIIGAGATEGAMDASNMLKPLLSSGEIRCIGSTTYQEFRNVFSKNAALSRRFQKVDIVEPSPKDTIKILLGLKDVFEAHHSVKYATPAIKAAVELSKKYIHDRFLPDKAIDVIDEAGAANRLLPKNRQKSVITEKDIEYLISKQAQIPSKHVTVNIKERLRNMERDLKLLIFGQDGAIEKVCAAIKLAKSGLTEGEKPIGSFLFAGPTGVGKTELAKQLASTLGINFLRFDMSEYMEKHSISRLIGAPPGYLGFDQGGLLTDAINKQPHSVVLLDEIEKAHPDIYNILLQVFDYGFLTDNNGRKSDFRNCVIILTTNAGAFEQSQNAIGFGKMIKEGVAMEAIKRTFSPEFLNRLDSLVHFRGLDCNHILRVVDKFLIELERLLIAKAVSLSVENDVKDWIALKGYDSKYGARPIHRLIQEEIKKPLVEELLFGRLERGGSVQISFKDKKLSFSFEEAQSKSELIRKTPTQKKATKKRIAKKKTAEKKTIKKKAQAAKSKTKKSK